MNGKIVYQKHLADGTAAACCFARPFRFLEHQLLVPSGDIFEEEVGSALPPDSIKLGCTVERGARQSGERRATNVVRSRSVTMAGVRVDV